MAETKHEYTTYDETLRGPNEERDIDEGDWRDPDKLLVLDGTKVYSKDTAFNLHSAGSAIEPGDQVRVVCDGASNQQDRHGVRVWTHPGAVQV